MPLTVQPGDVLLYSNPVNKAVLFGQKLISFGRELNASIVHAGVVTTGAGISSFAGTQSVQVAHAISKAGGFQGGPTVQTLKVSTHPVAGAWGRVDIWRAPGHMAYVSHAAGQIAQKWAQPPNGSHHMSFATRKAFMAGFGGSNFGSDAQRRAQDYATHRDLAGGPPSLRDATVGKAMFCSMFVVAVYQAALGAGAWGQMDVDARYVSPMKLHDVINRKGWDYVGAAFETSSGLMVVKNNGDEVKV